MAKYIKQGTVYTKRFYLLCISFHSDFFLLSEVFRVCGGGLLCFKFYGFSFHINRTNLPLPSAGPLDFSPFRHLSSELTENGLPRCFSSLLPPTSCLGRPRGPRAAPAGRVSIGDILAGPSVALPPLHPVTHVRPAALSHAASASGTQPRAPAFRTLDPSW